MTVFGLLWQVFIVFCRPGFAMDQIQQLKTLLAQDPMLFNLIGGLNGPGPIKREMEKAERFEKMEVKSRLRTRKFLVGFELTKFFILNLESSSSLIFTEFTQSSNSFYRVWAKFRHFCQV